MKQVISLLLLVSITLIAIGQFVFSGDGLYGDIQYTQETMSMAIRNPADAFYE